MIDPKLEEVLHTAFVDARRRRHGVITVEHLLYWLLESDDCTAVVKACGATVDAIRAPLLQLLNTMPAAAGTADVDTQPTLGFQRVIQRAIMHVQSAGDGEKRVMAANCLVAVFGESDSESLRILDSQNITRLDVVNFIASGIHKKATPNGGEQLIELIEKKALKPQLQNPARIGKQTALAKCDGGLSRRLFISYSHVDTACLDRLMVHLRPLERDSGICCWSDKKIRAGDKWKDEIKSNLDDAIVAILLVTADFLASDFIANNELPPLLIAAESKGLRILPLILKPCGYRRDPILRSFQSINDPVTPLLGMTHIEQEFLYDKLAEEVAAEMLLRRQTEQL